jgi:nucleoside-diphosphate-sugar epimerase
MRTILITGEKSYIGVSFKQWVDQWSDIYNVDFISLRNEEWKSKDFSKYDVIIHVAAIVHKKEQPEMKRIYDRVNKDITIELAYKAKQSGVKQFIFMSTLSVYGLEGHIEKDVVINKDTPCYPNTLYGISKLEAENELVELSDDLFRVATIRAPMIYGPECPGNYRRLRDLVLKLPLFPLVNNKRSMLFIDNLSEFIRLLIENEDDGIFFPQNKEYVNTNNLAELISKVNSHKIISSRILAFAIKVFGKRMNIINKVFGNLMIDVSLSNYMNFEYCVSDLPKSIEICEINDRNRC